MRAHASEGVYNLICRTCVRVLIYKHMPKRPAPKRYYNIRIDEETYKQMRKHKGNVSIVDYMRILVLGEDRAFAKYAEK